MLTDKLVPLTENKTSTDMNKLVMRLMKTHEPFAVWGAGATGKNAIAYFQKSSAGKLTPHCIIDNNPATWDKNGVISPDRFFSMTERPKILLICVYVANEIISQIKAAGYQGETIICSTSLLFDVKKKWQFYEEHISELEKVYDLLSDDKSRKTLEGFLNCVRSGNPTYLEKINDDSINKMLNPSILKYTDQEIFADIGAFTGDTLFQFLKFTDRKYKKIIGFELDPSNYNILCQRIANEKNIILKNAAVGMASQKVKFTSGLSESCIVSETGNCEVNMVSLNDVPEMSDATIIKISTNGTEFSVLQGAEKLIKKNVPKLAVYVGGQLLWEIPQYLKKIVPEYQLYLRHYGIGLQALACYAVND